MTEPRNNDDRLEHLLRAEGSHWRETWTPPDLDDAVGASTADAGGARWRRPVALVAVAAAVVVLVAGVVGVADFLLGGRAGPHPAGSAGTGPSAGAPSVLVVGGQTLRLLQEDPVRRVQVASREATTVTVLVRGGPEGAVSSCAPLARPYVAAESASEVTIGVGTYVPEGDSGSGVCFDIAYGPVLAPLTLSGPLRDRSVRDAGSEGAVGVGDESTVDTLGAVPGGFAPDPRNGVVAVPDGATCDEVRPQSHGDPPTCPSRTWVRGASPIGESLTLAVVPTGYRHLNATDVLLRGTVDGRPAVVGRPVGDTSSSLLWVGWTDAAGVSHELFCYRTGGVGLTPQQLLDAAGAFVPGR